MSARGLVLAGLVSLCVLVGLLALAITPAFGVGAVTHDYEMQITGLSLSEPFGESWGLAFGSAGELFVADAEKRALDVFDQSNVFAPPQLVSSAFSEPYTRSVAVSAATGDVYVGESGSSDVDVFKPEGANKYGLLNEDHFGGYVYVAVDNHPVEASDPRAGDVYVLSGLLSPKLYVVKPGAEGRLEGLGEEVPAPAGGFTNGDTQKGQTTGDRAGLAVDAATGNLYVANPEKHVVDVFNDKGVEQPAITGSGTPAGAASFTPISVAVDDADEAIYVVDEANGVVDEFSRAGSWLGQIKQTMSGKVLEEPLGVAVQEHAGASKGDVYVSDGASKAVDVFGAAAVPIPAQVNDESVSSVTSTSATLQAQVDSEGNETSYYFQYGTGSCTTSPASCTSMPISPAGIGSGVASVEVSQHLQGLEAGTVYHYRVVAQNTVGIVDGPDRTFTTQRAGSALGLPDGRQYEMVTPPDKHGALFFGLNEGYIQNGVDPFVAEASVNGNAVADLASQPTEGGPQGNISDAMVLSTRGPAGWSSQVIAPPHNAGTGPLIHEGEEYRLFSEDLSRGIVQPFGFGRGYTPLSAGAPEPTAYLRTDYLNGDVSEHCQSSCYEPLVTKANTPEGTVFGMLNGFCDARIICGPDFVDATPDLSHVVLRSLVQLTSIPSEPEFSEGFSFYEWSGGQLQPLYLLPQSEGGVGVYDGELEPRAPVDHQLSDDGSLFFSYHGHLYLHDFAKGESVRLDVAQGVAEPSEGGARFLYASSDGSRAFFTDSKQLTKTPGGGVYECRIVEVAGNITCELELTGLTGGSLVGGSQDASYLYFVGAGERLIVDHYSGREWTTTEGPVIPQTRTSGFLPYTLPFEPISALPPYRISPNGRFLAFMSDRNLTDYDNRDAVSGKPDAEVYLYDASSNRLVCASCNPTGARPVGTESTTSELVGGEYGDGSNPSVASNVPPWTRSTGTEPNNNSNSIYQPRYLSDSGRLFFDSNDALVPQDVNGTQDVYEYEPVGVGSCSASSVTFGERSDGCVGLISSGSSPEESAFMDASATGGDVFFITLAKLVSQDYDNALDVYDAHECSVAVPCYPPEPVSPPVCSTGDACKAAPTPQPTIFGPSPSATFSGAGNVIPSTAGPGVGRKSLSRAQKLARALRACRKKGHRQRAVCERNARTRYGATARSHKAGAKRKGRG